jgi:hypothetical protein
VRISDLRLLAGPGASFVREQASVLHTGEACVLTLENEPEPAVVDSALRHLRMLPAPTVLIGDPVATPSALVDAIDVCVTEAEGPPDPWVAGDATEVADAVRRQPVAALALVALLRVTARLDLWSAIVGESATYSVLLASRGHLEWLRRRPARDTGRESDGRVLVAREGDMLVITLNRPASRNAIDTQTRDALVDALRLAAADAAVRVELRGRGPSFSSGGDLDEFGTVQDAGTAHAVRLSRHPGEAVAAVASRTTAFLQGSCVGAGVELPAFAGTVVADPQASFRLPEVGMGLIPGAGGTVSITRRVGRHRSAWLALTGREIDASTAVAWGLVDRVAPVP